ncbi:MAG: tetratricopeptide repeat protein [Bdellovibrio sp.]
MIKSLLILMLLFQAKVYAAGLDVESSLLGDTAHFEFLGRDNWNYDLQKKTEKKQTYIELRLPALSEKAIAKLRAFKGGPVRDVTVDRSGPDGSHIVRLDLNVADVESFDYLTDQPSRLIVDLYPQKPKVVKKENSAEEGAVESDETAATSGKAKKSTTAKSGKNQNRKPATTDILIVKNDTIEDLKAAAPQTEVQSGVFDGSDPGFSRFSIQDYEIREDAIIQSREKDYIDFPMLHEQPGELQVLNSRRPIYEIDPRDSKDEKVQAENKMARLLVTLFKNKRYHVFLKTVDWFFEKYPDSEYDEIIRYMWADTHYALFQEKQEVRQFDLAMARYREVLTKHPQSQLAERTLLLMGYASLDRGDYLGTLRMFQQHLAKLPASVNRDLSRLAIAESYLKLNQFDDAIALYEQIEKDASRQDDRIRAAYLKGDVYFQRKNDLLAIQTYQQALKKYPEAGIENPNALYNQASSYFREGGYRDSLNVFKEFLTKFPSHPYAGYAMTRVGEILDILGADSSRVMGAYLEAYFRYGDSPSAIVARLRLLGTRMRSMKAKEVDKAVAEMIELASKSDLPKMAQFSTLLIAEGYTSRGEYDKSIDRLVKFYQANPTNADTARLNTKIVRNINEKIREQVQTGKFMDALKTHKKFADSWLKSSDRIDTKFWVGKAFEQAGVFAESSKLYRDVLNKIYALQGTKAGFERSIFEKLPSTDYLHLRLAASEFAQGKWNQAYDQLREVQKPEALSESEQIERVQMGAALLEKKGEPEFALRYLAELIKTWKGVPSLVAGPYFDAGDLEMKLGKADDALKSFKRVDELMKDSGQVSPLVHAKALEKIAQIYLGKKQPEQALPVLEKLLNTYEKTRPLASLRYKMGLIHLEKGQVQKAAEVWAELKTERTSFWRKLAQEQLKGSEWGDEYKKYIKRIPAMSNDGK